jgi:phosphatidylserine synthase
MGLVWVFIAYSFWKGAEIGWVVGIAMSVLVAVLNYGTYPIETVLAIIVALYLIVPKGVRSWFSKPGISKWAGT